MILPASAGQSFSEGIPLSFQSDVIGWGRLDRRAKWSYHPRMITLCRMWIKLAVAAGLVIGCNIVAPSLSMATSMPVLMADMPCHNPGTGKHDALPEGCAKGCMALPATIAPLEAPVLVAGTPFLLAIHSLAGTAPPPAIPPPRESGQA